MSDPTRYHQLHIEPVPIEERALKAVLSDMRIWIRDGATLIEDHEPKTPPVNASSDSIYKGEL
ncbi:hypothetical protein KEM54_001654, partial [Ascosphaera aggregata]